MRRIKVRSNVAMVGALIGLLAISGCGAKAAKPSASPWYGVAPTGTAVVIEPVKSIDGAKRYTTDVFGIDVPAGMVPLTRTLDNGVGTEVLWLTEAGSDRASVKVTVTPQQKPATDEIVAASSVFSELEAHQGGLVTDLKRSPATWRGMEYAVSLTGPVNPESGSGTVPKDFILVTTRDPGRTSIVTVWAEAPQGQLQKSQAYAVLRTLRFGN